MIRQKKPPSDTDNTALNKQIQAFKNACIRAGFANMTNQPPKQRTFGKRLRFLKKNDGRTSAKRTLWRNVRELANTPIHLPRPRPNKKIALALIFALVVLPIAVPSAYANTNNGKARSLFSPFKKMLTFKKKVKIAPLASLYDLSPQTAQTDDTQAQNPQTQSIVASDVLPSNMDSSSTPDLLTVLQAEFAIDRDDPATALDLYKQEANKQNATAVFERALGLSLQYESPAESLSFAKAWQENNKDHIPVWFYVTHLALKSGDYDTAAANLNMILEYDVNADLQRIFEGILPSDRTAQSELSHALEAVSNDQNPSLSALKAALLTQLGNHDIALLWANQAILTQPKNLAFLTLKADMLQGSGQSAKLIAFLNGAINKTTGETQKQLYLYEIRHLIDQNDLKTAWKILKTAHQKFGNDHEITLLAGLVGIDVKAYGDAVKILTKLANQPSYAGQANYYIGIAYERQNQTELAITHFLAVNDSEWVLNAQKKVLTFYLNQGKVNEAFGLLTALREEYPMFASDSYLLQANILANVGQSDAAKTLLSTAINDYPDDTNLLYAQAQLLDDNDDYGQKLDSFIKLQQLDPYNARYQLEHARLILLKNPHDNLAITDVLKVLQQTQTSDKALYKDGLVVLSRNDLVLGRFGVVIGRLGELYKAEPNLLMGELLLRAYYGLGEHETVATLLDDMTNRFGKKDATADTNDEPLAKPIPANKPKEPRPQNTQNDNEPLSHLSFAGNATTTPKKSDKSVLMADNESTVK